MPADPTARDRAMITSPDEWPAWPYLPMKNREERLPGGWPKLGFFYNASTIDDTVVFYEGIMHQAQEAKPVEKTIDELLTEGWRVD